MTEKQGFFFQRRGGKAMNTCIEITKNNVLHVEPYND